MQLQATLGSLGCLGRLKAAMLHYIFSRILPGIGALVGAGGATAYMNGFDISSMARSLLVGPPHQSMPWQAQMNNKGEMDALYRLVSFA